MGVRFYCGLNEKRWNHHPVQPGPYACVAPVYGKTARTSSKTPVSIPPGTEVIQDSGAFADSWVRRLSPEEAYERQIAHAEQYGYADAITHRASYDLLIDEVWEAGRRTKRRWTEADAEWAVEETVAGAQYAAKHRNDTGLILSAQGVTARQYQDCVERIVPLLGPGDILGLGGWCIIGKYPRQMMTVFRDTLHRVIPLASRQGVRRVHIWGVIYPRALGELLWMADQHEIAVSTDSAAPSYRPAFGEWGYGDWRDNAYQRPPVETRGLERARHVAATRAWLSRLHETRYYREPEKPSALEQLEMPLGD